MWHYAQSVLTYLKQSAYCVCINWRPTASETNEWVGSLFQFSNKPVIHILRLYTEIYLCIP